MRFQRHLLLALTEHRLGQAVEARQWLDKSKTWLADPPDKYSSELPVRTFWTFRVGWNALRIEAESVIDKPMSAQ